MPVSRSESESECEPEEEEGGVEKEADVDVDVYGEEEWSVGNPEKRKGKGRVAKSGDGFETEY